MRRWGLVVAASVVTCLASGSLEAQALSAHQLGFRGPAFFAVRVRDVEVSAQWYQRVLGLELINPIDAPNGSYAIRILSGGGLTVELIEQAGSEPVPSRHEGHFKAGLYVTDIESFHRHLLASGADADEQIVVDQVVGVRTFVFRDHEGNLIQALEACEEVC